MATRYAVTLHNARSMQERGNDWVVFAPAHLQGQLFQAYKTEGGAKLGLKRFKPSCLPEIMTMDAFIARLSAHG